MKNLLFVLFAVFIGVTACQIEETNNLSVENVELSARIEQDHETKTILGEDNNIFWSENDQIIAFMKTSYGHQYQVKPSFAGKTYADFSRITSASDDILSAGIELNHIVAYYPYNEDIQCVKFGDNYSLDVFLPTEQTYNVESFGNGSWPMAAVSEDNDINFMNICGGMMLQLKGTQKVTSITLQGKNNEVLSGAATVVVYTDNETKPAITMSSDASTSVVLKCGTEGIQLDENSATKFIIALPPILLSKGFIVTVTDFEENIYTLETDKANTVLRSSLLVMPEIHVNKSDNNQDSDDELYIPVTSISIQAEETKCLVDEMLSLSVVIIPSDASNQNITWSSDNPTVASINQEGILTAHSKGTAIISASADGIVSNYEIQVIEPIYYIDEYGVNHGRGIFLGNNVWAPVNCGYKAPTYDNDNNIIDKGYPYGKHYQWGRQYGQGLGGEYDDDVIEVTSGCVSLEGGQHKSNANKFYKEYDETGDWLATHNNKLWNNGTEAKPIKGEYDPCPDGWRVPTLSEMRELSSNHSNFLTLDTGMTGRYFSGLYEYSETSPRIFLPAAGRRYDLDGKITKFGELGSYWSSTTYSYNAEYLSDCDEFTTDRALGLSVRCIQE